MLTVGVQPMKSHPGLAVVALLFLSLSVWAAPDKLNPLLSGYRKAVTNNKHDEARAYIPLLAQFATERAIAPLFKSLKFLVQDEQSYQLAIRELAKLPPGTGQKRIVRAVKQTILENIEELLQGSNFVASSNVKKISN